MIRKTRFSLPAVHFNSLLFICALLPALLFKGPQMEFFAITQIILMIWLGRIALQSNRSGLSIPKTGLALCLTLFWLWLAVTLAWSPAPAISTFNFWWIGSLALVFWLYTLTPDRDALWSRVAAVLLVLAVALALMGVYQVLVLGQDARSVFETRNSHAALLNLVALPAAAYFLILLTDKDAAGHGRLLLGASLYVLFFSIFFTMSRGAILSLIIGMTVLVALAARYASRRGIVALLLLVAAAFLCTKLTHGGLGQRVLAVTHDYLNRWVIWKSSWNLLQAAPWRGAGLGLFYLAYPPYSNPADSSGGFFVHNDYLQIWIEAGLPGLLLLISVQIAALWLLVRALRKKTLPRNTRIETVGLFCGLLAVAVHSFVDFNLYILSIMMISGLVMGRFHELGCRELKMPCMRIRFSRRIGARAYPVIVMLLVLLPIFYFTTLGLANSYYEKALAQGREARLRSASRSLATAEWLAPADDRILIARADLYRHAITLLPREDRNGKEALYANALKLLDEARQENSLRALTSVIRARLYRQNPALAGAKGDELAAESFHHALALNPRLLLGRMEYAELLLQQDDKDQALQSLEQGVR